MRLGISIHALLAESDRQKLYAQRLFSDFYPRSPCGERRSRLLRLSRLHAFLSTLSLRRATRGPGGQNAVILYFYPRSPCGERPYDHVASCQAKRISIHALLAESDAGSLITLGGFGVDFYPRSPCGERPGKGQSSGTGIAISIHALLAESDPIIQKITVLTIAFLSTLSLRRATNARYTKRAVAKHFYPRSPCGERQRIEF